MGGWKKMIACLTENILLHRHSTVSPPSGRRDDRGRSPPAAYSYAQQGGAYRCNFLVFSPRWNQPQLLFSTPFDAIADFARRTTGGGGRSRRDDSRERDLRFLPFNWLLLLHCRSTLEWRIFQLDNSKLGSTQ